MARDLMLSQGGYGLSRRDAGLAAREISRGNGEMQVREARIERETEVTICKGDSLTAVTAHAMTDVARIGQLQQQLEMQSPGSSARLNALADSHMFGLADLAGDHQRRMRRF